MARKDKSKAINIRPAYVPKGLKKCLKCGEYKGTIKYTDSEGSYLVSCSCDNIRCKHCGRKNVRRPVSNYYVVEENRLTHVPYFAHIAGCRECAIKRGFMKAPLKSPSKKTK